MKVSAFATGRDRKSVTMQIRIFYQTKQLLHHNRMTAFKTLNETTDSCFCNNAT